jgi:transposase
MTATLIETPIVVGAVGAVGNVAAWTSTPDGGVHGDVVQAAVESAGGLHDLADCREADRPSADSMAASASMALGAEGPGPGDLDAPVATASTLAREPMHPVLTRHAVQVLRNAGHGFTDIALACNVPVRSARRIAMEAPVDQVDDALERTRRGIGRPKKAEPFRSLVVETLATEPDLMALEILRRARARGYDGGRSAFYELVAELRPPRSDFHMRFEGLAGEFSQHDFGQVDVRFVDGSVKRVHFFASRLKYSRWAEVSLVQDEGAETLVRTLLDHFVLFGGVPLCAVFDRPKTVAIEWKSDGTITKWNATFAMAAMEIGFTAEVCWAYQPQQKGSVEAIVKWVKNSFFKQRRFVDVADLQEQLAAWLHEVNTTRPSRATKIIPAERLMDELDRLRAPKIGPDDLAIHLPVSVGPTATVVVDGHVYELPPATCGLSGTAYLHKDRVRFEIGRTRLSFPRGQGVVPSTTPEIRAARLAEVSGKRGKRYLRRQQVLDIGPAAERFITEVVHANPDGWWKVVDLLHDLLQCHGPTALHLALRAAVDVSVFEVAFVTEVLGRRRPQQNLFSSEGAHA